MSTRKPKLILPSPLNEKWRIAGSGISVQAGPARIRMEASGTREQREAIARAVALLPDLLPNFDRLLRFAETVESTISDAEVENARTVLAAILGNTAALKDLGHVA